MPKTLVVSEAKTLLPRADIVWRDGSGIHSVTLPVRPGRQIVDLSAEAAADRVQTDSKD